MKKLSRRNFVKTTVISAASLSILGLSGCKKSTETAATPAETTKSAEAASTTAPKKAGITVVIAGGGYGGATAAKYLKLLKELFQDNYYIIKPFYKCYSYR